MAYCTGPCSTMPGHHSASPAGEVCDNHEDRPAVHRVQGETDSFGCEGFDFCQECYDAHKAAVAEYAAEAATGCCDWCKTMATDLRPTRDYDEGSCGRLYDVCGECRRRASDEAAAELEEYYNSSDYDPCFDLEEDD